MSNQKLIKTMPCGGICKLGISGSVDDMKFKPGLQFLKQDTFVVTSSDQPRINPEYRYVKTVTDAADFLNVSGEFAVKAKMDMIKVTGSGSYLTSDVNHNTSIQVLVRAQNITRVESFDNTEVKIDDRVNLDYIGPYYAQAISYGGEMTINLVFQFKDQKSKEEIEAEISASMKEASVEITGDAKFSKEMSSLASNSTLKVDACMEGAYWDDVFKDNKDVLTAMAKDPSTVVKYLNIFCDYKDKNLTQYPWMVKVAPVAALRSGLPNPMDRNFFKNVDLDDFTMVYSNLYDLTARIDNTLERYLTTIDDQSYQSLLDTGADTTTKLATLRKYVTDIDKSGNSDSDVKTISDKASAYVAEEHEWYHKNVGKINDTIDKVQAAGAPPDKRPGTKSLLSMGTVSTGYESKPTGGSYDKNITVALNPGFVKAPRIAVGLNRIDMLKQKPTQVQTIVSNVTNGSFNVRAKSGPDSSIFECAYSYIAVVPEY